MVVLVVTAVDLLKVVLMSIVKLMVVIKQLLDFIAEQIVTATAINLMLVSFITQVLSS